MSSRPSSSSPPPSRRRTNLTIDSRLLSRARELGINLSQASERGLVEEIRRVERERWRAENRGAIESYNRFLDKQGLPLDGMRLF